MKILRLSTILLSSAAVWASYQPTYSDGLSSICLLYTSRCV